MRDEIARGAASALRRTDAAGWEGAEQEHQGLWRPAGLASDERLMRRGGRVYAPGLGRRLERVLDALATADAAALGGVHREIERSSARLEAGILVRRIRPQELSPDTRATRGWLALLCDADRLRRYHCACRDAHEVFAQSFGQRDGRALRVHLRPMRGIYRVGRDGRSGIRIELPTPTLSFASAAFKDLAELMRGRRAARPRVLEAMAGPEYRELQRLLASLGGAFDEGSGLWHDLGAAFERVNLEYFAGSMERPRLRWSARPGRRKHGHYDFLEDTVVLSRALDSESVPAFVVDFVLYHELLHRKHGVEWRRGKARVHTPRFREDERRFRLFEEAQAELARLSLRRPTDPYPPTQR